MSDWVAGRMFILVRVADGGVQGTEDLGGKNQWRRDFACIYPRGVWYKGFADTSARDTNPMRTESAQEPPSRRDACLCCDEHRGSCE